ncbi:hypothetical protein KXD40_001521 [Peronospora effusa]|uniref:Uncharacterized protein n=1 Tax=Peronospora effusa TaxID=542832 RepID=A0A3M6VLQ9_9STRA|nr:hypothetical protein DD238_001112 [Peronospora effusa]UIZ26535.1 hypothetical protein KXD40_001521 [Peronospora effusa]
MWEVLAQRLALYEYKCRIRSWKRLVLLTQSPVNLEFSVLRQVRECSSVDHINESADNTLTRSHCDIGVTLLHTMAVADDPVQFVAMAKRLQRDDDEVETLVYESITYCIANDMKEDVSSSVARWMQEFNLPPYYTCLSYVGVTGLLEFELSLE